MAFVRKWEILVTGDAKSLLKMFGAMNAAALTTAKTQKSAFQKMATAGKGLTLGIGALAVGAAAGLVKVGANFDKAYDKIRINTGASGKRLEQLKSDFKGVARQSGASFETIGDALSQVHRRLGVTGVPLQNLTRQFIFLDKRGVAPLETTIPAVTRLFGDWSIKTGKQSATLDKLFRASQATGVGVDQLAELMVKFGSPLRQLGLDFDFSVAMFSRFEKEGVNMQTAMPGLRMALKNFAKAGREPAPALMETFKAIRTAGSTAEANTLAFKVFGTRAGPDLASAIREGRFDLDGLMKTISGGKETIFKAGKETSSFSQKWALFKNKVLVALEPLATKLFNALGQGMDKLGPKVESLVKWISEDLVPAFEGVWNFVSTYVIPILSKIIGWFAKNQVAIKALAAVVTAAVAAMIASYLALKIKTIAMAAFMVAKWAWVGVQFMIHAAKIAAAMLLAMGPVGWVILGVGAIAVAVALNWSKVKRLTSALFGWLRRNWPLIVAILTGPVGVAVLAIIRHFDKIKAATSSAFNWVKSKITGAWNATWGAVKRVGSNIVSWFRTFKDRVIGIFSAARSWLASAGRNIIAGLRDAMKWVWEHSLVGWLVSRKTNIVNFFKNPGRILWNIGKAILSGLWNGLKAGWKRVKDWFLAIPRWIKEHKGPIEYDRKLLEPAGRAIMAGFLRGLKRGTGGALGFLRRVGAKITDLFSGWFSGGQDFDFGAVAGVAGVERWRSVAKAALAYTGSPASWIDSLMHRLKQESGGNQFAINLWDSNAKRGDPSRGLMQTIGSTFNAYAGELRGRGIYDPFANIVAAIRYTVSRYGSGPAGWNRPGGYERGAWKVPRAGGWTHKDEMVIPARIAEVVRREVRSGGGRGRPNGDVHVHVAAPVRDINDLVRKTSREFAWAMRVAG